MIEVASYLRGPDGQFTQVGAVTSAPPNPRYVEGVLNLTIDGVSIIGMEMWDYIDQLWAYIGEMVWSLQGQDQVSTYFPDQPIKLSFSRHGKNRVLVTLQANEEIRKASTDEGELIASLRDQGSFFLRR